MRHENHYFFVNVFGFAGLTVDEHMNNVRAWWESMKLPYLMPHAWHAVLALAFGVGGVIGCAIAAYTLAVRGLL